MSDVLLREKHGPARSVAGAGVGALMRAVEVGDAAEVARLVAAGAATDVPLADGETMLMRAAAKGHADVVRVLLDGGAEVNAKRHDGFTPLLIAAFRGHADVARLLLERGADATARTRVGSTAGAWAAAHEFAEFAEVLKSAPSSVQESASGVLVGAGARAAKIDESMAPEIYRGGLNGAGQSSSEAEQLGATRVEEVTVISAPFMSGTARHYRVALPFALALAAVAGVALASVWRANPPSAAQTEVSPASGASNVTTLPAPPAAAEAAPNVQPSPAVSPTVVPSAPGGSSIPVIIMAPSDVPPAGSNKVVSGSNSTTTAAPALVSEGGAQSSEGKTSPGDAANPDGEKPAEGLKGEGRQGANTRAGDDTGQGEGAGAEIRTAAPPKPAAQPPSTITTQPSPAPSPRKKVIQWP